MQRLLKFQDAPGLIGGCQSPGCPFFLHRAVAGLAGCGITVGFYQLAVAPVLAFAFDCATLNVHDDNVTTTLLICKPLSNFYRNLSYGVLNVKSGEIRYSLGGHNLPYLVNSDGKVTEMNDVGGLLLGKFEDADYSESSIQLKPGDTIMTFTDGITEAENEKVIFSKNNASSTI